MQLRNHPLSFSFGRTGDGSYRLEQDGSLEAEARFSFAFKLTCHQQDVQSLPRGYCGSGRHSSSTLQPSRRFNSDAFLRRLIANAELATEELAVLVAQSPILGPKPGEPDFHHLDGNTPSDELQKWVIRYYEANGLDDPKACTRWRAAEHFSFNRLRLGSCSTTWKGASKIRSRYWSTANWLARESNFLPSSANGTGGIFWRAVTD